MGRWREFCDVLKKRNSVEIIRQGNLRRQHQESLCLEGGFCISGRDDLESSRGITFSMSSPWLHWFVYILRDASSIAEELELLV